MNFKYLSLGKGLCCLLLMTLVVLGAGCSGIHATKSVSPLDFFLPGLGMTDPPEAGLTQTPPAVAPALATAPEPSTS